MRVFDRSASKLPARTALLLTADPGGAPRRGAAVRPRGASGTAGEAALALASRSGGVALDVPGFRISSAEDLVSR